MSVNPGEVLGAFVADLTYDDLPERVRERVTAILLDTVASAVAGRHGDETAQIQALARNVAGSGQSTVLGSSTKLAPAGAALVNGYQVTAVTVCDVFRHALCHVTPQAVPPALAVAEERDVTGKQLIAGVAAGLETTVRIGYGIHYEAFRKRGWHSPGVIGPFGGAAAAGNIMGLDAMQMRNAFGLAGSQAAGTFAHWGTPTIKFHQSRGSLSGLLAANLAEQDFLSAADIINNEDGGLFHAYSDGGDPARVVDKLGEQWDLEVIALRRWPAASSIQVMITALFALVESGRFEVDDVEHVDVELSETVYKLHGSLPWDTKFSAQLSAPYLTSVILHDKACWLDQFQPERISKDDVGTFARNKVNVSAAADLAGTASRITVTLTDGTVIADERAIAKGDPEDFPTLDEIVGKFREASRGLITDDKVEQAITGFTDIENVDSVAQLLTSVVGNDA